MISKLFFLKKNSLIDSLTDQTSDFFIFGAAEYAGGCALTSLGNNNSGGIKKRRTKVNNKRGTAKKNKEDQEENMINKYINIKEVKSL